MELGICNGVEVQTEYKECVVQCIVNRVYSVCYTRYTMQIYSEQGALHIVQIHSEQDI